MVQSWSGSVCGQASVSNDSGSRRFASAYRVRGSEVERGGVGEAGVGLASKAEGRPGNEDVGQ